MVVPTVYVRRTGGARGQTRRRLVVDLDGTSGRGRLRPADERDRAGLCRPCSRPIDSDAADLASRAAFDLISWNIDRPVDDDVVATRAALEPPVRADDAGDRVGDRRIRGDRLRAEEHRENA